MQATGGARRLITAALVVFLAAPGGASAQDGSGTDTDVPRVLDELFGGPATGGSGDAPIPLPGIGGDLGDLPTQAPEARTEPPPAEGPVPDRDALPAQTDVPEQAATPGDPAPVDAPPEGEAVGGMAPEGGAGLESSETASGERGAGDGAAGDADADAAERVQGDRAGPDGARDGQPPRAAADDEAAVEMTEEAAEETAEETETEAPAQPEAAAIAPPDGTGGDAPGTDPLPTVRSFRMGFTPLPYDLTPEAFDETYARIAENGDIVSHLLDEGVPWTAAANGTTFHPNVEADIARRIAGTRTSSAVLLSVTPLAQDRVSLAGEWAEAGGMPLPESLEGLSFDHPDVVSAFVGYALRMIDRFDPDYFAYAIEITDLATEPADRREAFVAFAAEVHRAVKRVHPELPVFPTWSLGNRTSFTDDLRAFVEALAPYSDILAVSTYPYVWDGVGGEADRLPDDWFAKMAEVLPDKPFAVAQTGFLSGTYRNLPSLVWISAGPEDQAEYVSDLLSEAARLEAEFVVWYVPVDYDRLWDRLDAMGMSEWFAQWMRTGLWSSDFQPRPALQVWSEWLALPVWE